MQKNISIFNIEINKPVFLIFISVLLLISAMVLLIQDRNDFAKEIVQYMYYTLFLGTVWQLGLYFWNVKRNS